MLAAPTLHGCGEAPHTVRVMLLVFDREAGSTLLDGQPDRAALQDIGAELRLQVLEMPGAAVLFGLLHSSRTVARDLAIALSVRKA